VEEAERKAVASLSSKGTEKEEKSERKCSPSTSLRFYKPLPLPLHTLTNTPILNPCAAAMTNKNWIRLAR
jgi:hypothetical protein